ncbi:hypothetical protein [Arenibaculum pallidiluteum]|uniref:hypothetical protein n=1 Tax=Arenibaculum pallidiluteum TaxID=2812559 RepID=UPI001A977298|nr:hypothetical protein [Arenibaculum pallidiluteum]
MDTLYFLFGLVMVGMVFHWAVTHDRKPPTGGVFGIRDPSDAPAPTRRKPPHGRRAAAPRGGRPNPRQTIKQ